MKAIFIIFVVAGLMFLSCILGAAFGALAGWVVGLAFPETMGMMLNALGLSKAEMWQFGAMLGFVSGFFRSTVTSK